MKKKSFIFFLPYQILIAKKSREFSKNEKENFFFSKLSVACSEFLQSTLSNFVRFF